MVQRLSVFAVQVLCLHVSVVNEDAKLLPLVNSFADVLVVLFIDVPLAATTLSVGEKPKGS